MGIPCFLIEPTDHVRQELRRYTPGRWDADQKRTVYEPPCPLTNGGYHNAQVRIEDAPEQRNAEGYITNGSRGDEHAHADPRWPTHCACGYAFTEADVWQLFCSPLFRRADTGEETTLRDAPAGAMLRMPWQQRRCTSQDADPAPLAVVTPGGLWTIDECATDCAYYGMGVAQRPAGHHCWTRSGTPPLVTARPSIQMERYHGFLTDGVLNDA